jgi:hypothetical protein
MDMEFMACAFVVCVNISSLETEKKIASYVYVPIHYQEVFVQIIIGSHS